MEIKGFFQVEFISSVFFRMKLFHLESPLWFQLSQELLTDTFAKYSRASIYHTTGNLSKSPSKLRTNWSCNPFRPSTALYLELHLPFVPFHHRTKPVTKAIIHIALQAVALSSLPFMVVPHNKLVWSPKKKIKEYQYKNRFFTYVELLFLYETWSSNLSRKIFLQFIDQKSNIFRKGVWFLLGYFTLLRIVHYDTQHR